MKQFNKILPCLTLLALITCTNQHIHSTSVGDNDTSMIEDEQSDITTTPDNSDDTSFSQEPETSELDSTDEQVIESDTCIEPDTYIDEIMETNTLDDAYDNINCSQEPEPSKLDSTPEQETTPDTSSDTAGKNNTENEGPHKQDTLSTRANTKPSTPDRVTAIMNALDLEDEENDSHALKYDTICDNEPVQAPSLFAEYLARAGSAFVVGCEKTKEGSVKFWQNFVNWIKRHKKKRDESEQTA